MVVGTGAGSTGVEWLAGKLLEELSGRMVVVVDINRGSVSRILTETGTRTGPATIDLICSLSLLTLNLGILNQK